MILGISQPAVKFHVDNVRRKLDTVNRPQAVARLASLGLLQPGSSFNGKGSG